jgi:regulator of extracellular matrix RemA (YlzA/DUF370 family)
VAVETTLPLRPPARRIHHAADTGLTFGTISATYGLNAGIITPAQFSVLVTVVVLTAVLPTAIAQRFFAPDVDAEQEISAPRSSPRTADDRAAEPRARYRHNHDQHG